MKLLVSETKDKSSREFISIINNSYIGVRYVEYITHPSINYVPKMNEISTKNTSTNISLNKNDGSILNTPVGGWPMKLCYVFFVYSYNGLVRGPIPKTVLLLHCYESSGGQIYPNILGLLKHNIVATVQTNPIVENKYIVNDLYTKKAKKKSTNFYTGGGYYDYANPDYRDISNIFSDDNAIICKRFVGTDSGTLVTTPFI
jgi:hypothetical protein